MPEDLPQYNTGLINDFSAEVWVGDQIPFVEVLPSANWLPYDVTHERQKDPVETSACVTFSLNNNLEIQHKFKGIDINLSDRFTAKMSDTQQNGNTFERVANSNRKNGVVLESVYPNLPKAETWADYYKPIPTEVMTQVIRLGDNWFNYSILPRSTNWAETLRQALKQCPLWITWPADPYHAMTLMNVRADNLYADVKDHYSNAIRRIQVKDIAIAAKVVINQYINGQYNMRLQKENGTVYIISGVNDKRKIGIADAESLALFGDEPVIDTPPSNIPESYTLSKGFLMNKKG